MVVDSTGIKVFGEGESKTRQHGVSKRRTWRKLHIGVDDQSQEIVASAVTTNDFKDNQLLGDLLNQVEGPLAQVSADGAYDSSDCYELIKQRGAISTIPPRKDAKIWSHGNCKKPPHPRHTNLRAIRQMGRKNGNVTAVIINLLCLKRKRQSNRTY